jgi:hypothetical protein
MLSVRAFAQLAFGSEGEWRQPRLFRRDGPGRCFSSNPLASCNQ